jgi:hypothetical protein
LVIVRWQHRHNGLVTDPWGSQQPPAITGAVPPLPPRLVRLAEVQASGVALTEEDPYAQGFPAALELPEVQELTGQGWRPLDGAPLYCLLPAAWPPQHRAWVPDRLPRVGMGATTDTYWGEIVPLPDNDYDPDGHIVAEARRTGPPAPPTGRIWLLRSPWPRIPVTVVQEIVWSIVERTPGEDEIAKVYHAACDVLTWPESGALAACPSEIRELLDAWAQSGRTGEAAAAVIEAACTRPSCKTRSPEPVCPSRSCWTGSPR